MIIQSFRRVAGALKETALLRLRGVSFPENAPKLGRQGVYIGASNSAGQGWAWARSLERARPEIKAVSSRFGNQAGTDSFSFAVDLPIYDHYAAHSFAWQRRQFQILSDYRAVIIESGDAILSRSFGDDAARQATALQEKGVQVGLLFHGSDIRAPDPHLICEPHSHFSVDQSYSDLFRQITSENRRLIDKLQVKVFVSTPDLLDEVPDATWLPVVVETSPWSNAAPISLGSAPVRVAHMPSSSMVKGTELVEPTLEKMVREGLIEYQAIQGVPHARMPEIYGTADVVIDQFRVGNYGVAACEAMAAGRLVVSHVSERVRELTHELTGEPLPIVEATPETLREVLTDIRANPEAYAAIAAAGVGFVDRNHNGLRSGAVLAEWVSDSDPGTPSTRPKR